MASRTRRLTSLLTGALAGLVAVQLALLAMLVSPGPVGSHSQILVLLGAAWVLWITTFACNYFLVRCGAVAERFRGSPRWINRPDFTTRTTLHFLINWSTLAVTNAVAWVAQPNPLASSLAWLTLIGTIAVWAAFNVLHRRMNRARNLALSTTIAGTLVVSSGLLIST